MELEHINRLTQQLYESITFRKGEKPRLDVLRELFLPEGRLVNNNGQVPLIFTPDTFIAMLEDMVHTNQLQQFSEVEISSQTHVFGKIAQRFSTYEARLDLTADEPYTVGINSLQLIKKNGEWKVFSLVWNDQDDSLQIPPHYR